MTKLFSWVPLPYCSPPGFPFPIKSLALSADVSPPTIHFHVLDKSLVSGLGRGPLLATETVSDFILGGSKITADGDFSHEIKRRLLLGRKVITSLESILKSRNFLGKECLGGEQEGKGAQENFSVSWLAVLGFMVMGLVSGLSLASHPTQSPSWWCTPSSANMDAREKDSGRWSDMWCLLLTFPELFRLVVAY